DAASATLLRAVEAQERTVIGPAALQEEDHSEDPTVVRTGPLPGDPGYNEPDLDSFIETRQLSQSPMSTASWTSEGGRLASDTVVLTDPDQILQNVRGRP